MPNILVRRLSVALCAVLGACLAACSAGAPAAPAPSGAVDTVVVGASEVPELERRVAALRFQVLERGAQIEDLQRRLEAARRETVRAMARLQTSASRAEAASVMAETEIALQALTGAAVASGSAEAAEARGLLQLSAAAFAVENYGGALYLAIQARSLAREGELRRTRAERWELARGEVLFGQPLPLETTRRSNVRSGPGTGYRVLFTLEPGSPVEGRSYLGQWVHVTDDEGRRGWIFHNLLAGQNRGGG